MPHTLLVMNFVSVRVVALTLWVVFSLVLCCMVVFADRFRKVSIDSILQNYADDSLIILKDVTLSPTISKSIFTRHLYIDYLVIGSFGILNIKSIQRKGKIEGGNQDLFWCIREFKQDYWILNPWLEIQSFSKEIEALLRKKEILSPVYQVIIAPHFSSQFRFDESISIIKAHMLEDFLDKIDSPIEMINPIHAASVIEAYLYGTSIEGKGIVNQMLKEK